MPAPDVLRRGRTALSREAFDALLGALDGDRDRAGEKYEVLRRKLVKFFEWRRCPQPEELADESIDRVCRRLLEGERILSSEPAAYFLGVARNVLRESWARERPLALVETATDPAARPDEPREDDRAMACLERCVEGLPLESRALVLEYYAERGAQRIARRGALARRLGIGPNALRIRLHRLRAILEGCVRGCLEEDETPWPPRPSSGGGTRAGRPK